MLFYSLTLDTFVNKIWLLGENGVEFIFILFSVYV
jgi:hypothetical protein